MNELRHRHMTEEEWRDLVIRRLDKQDGLIEEVLDSFRLSKLSVKVIGWLAIAGAGATTILVNLRK